MKNQRREQDFLAKSFFTPPALFLSLLVVALFLYWNSFTHYFVGDDFTWLRWASDCQKGACQPIFQLIVSYFTDAGGFFYRPGTKLYFYLLYHLFHYNQIAYHVGSMLVHVGNAFMVYLLSKRILGGRFASAITAFLFLSLNVHSETVYWIASINHLAASFFVLLGLLMYVYWRETNQSLFFFFSLVSVLCAPLFHELGIVAPLLIIGYDRTLHVSEIKKREFPWYYFIFLLQIPLYLFFRYISHSHWLSGDYNYSLKNLPFNVFGNALGYIGLIFGGSRFLPFYESLRTSARVHIGLTIIVILFIIGLLIGTGLLARKRVSLQFAQNYLLAGVLFFVPLLPFLALGNITYRYTYLASFGLILVMVQTGRIFVSSLPKTYHTLGIVVLSILALTFSYYNIYELERLAGDWRQAGSITHQFVGLSKQSQRNNGTIYVVNPPIRFHEAWVFPVGIEDAYWLGSGNNAQVVSITQKDEENIRKSSRNVEIYVFDKNESVKRE